jgi:hypothetical protein
MRICLSGAGFVAFGIDKGSGGVPAMATLQDDKQKDKQRQERTTATANADPYGMTNKRTSNGKNGLKVCGLGVRVRG